MDYYRVTLGKRYRPILSSSTSIASSTPSKLLTSFVTEKLTPRTDSPLEAISEGWLPALAYLGRTASNWSRQV